MAQLPEVQQVQPPSQPEGSQEASEVAPPAWLLGKSEGQQQAKQKEPSQSTKGSRSGPVPPKSSTSIRTQWRARMRMSAEDLESLENGHRSGERTISTMTDQRALRCADTALTFKDVSFSVKLPSGDEKTILEPVSGHWESGSVVAIMGPSGCGKSTLLDILADKKTAPYGGTVHFNGRPRDKLFRRISAYVPQEDVMPAHLTVLEAVMFNSELKCERPAKLSDDMAREWVERRLEVLGLDGVKDSYIGDASTLRGISGGQKRRLSLARRLASGAQLFFCDEPTSGLSATDAEACIRYMKHTAHFYNVLVLVVIHQPRVEVANLFDQLLLMTSQPGRLVYNGKMADSEAYWQKVGFPVPVHSNPVDYYMDLVTPGTHGAQVDLFVNYYNEHMKPEIDALVNEELHRPLLSPLEILQDQRLQMQQWGDLPPLRNSVYGVKFRRQLRLVFGRHILLKLRDKRGIMADMLSALAKAIVVGIVYIRTWELIAQQQIAFFFMLCMTASIDGLKHMPTVITERTIVKMETSESLYSDWAYIISFSTLGLLQGLIAHSLFVVVLFAFSGLPWALFAHIFLWSTLLSVTMDALYLMVAAAAKDSTTAIVMSAPFMMLFLLFNGFTATRSTVAAWMRWAIDISPVAYSVQQMTMAAAHVYRDDENLTNGYNYQIQESGYQDHPGIAIIVISMWFTVFKVVQLICFKMLNNIKR